MSPTDRLSDAPPFIVVASLVDEIMTRAIRRFRSQQEDKAGEDELARLKVEGVSSQTREG